MRQKDEKSRQLNHISSKIQGLTQISQGLYQGHLKENPEEILYLAHADTPSYGGLLRTAVVVDSQRRIRYTAVLESDDTRSYLELVVDQAGILDNYTGMTLDNLPEVDGVFGATLSSTAIIRGIEAAAQKIGTTRFGFSPQKQTNPKAATPETTKLLLICLFFAAVFAISRKGFKHRARARTAMMVVSIVTLGFWLGRPVFPVHGGNVDQRRLASGNGHLWGPALPGPGPFFHHQKGICSALPRPCFSTWGLPEKSKSMPQTRDYARAVRSQNYEKTVYDDSVCPFCSALRR